MSVVFIKHNNTQDNYCFVQIITTTHPYYFLLLFHHRHHRLHCVSFKFPEDFVFQNSKISRNLFTMRDMKDRLASLSSTYVWKKLMPFQKKGVKFSLLKSHGRTLFGDQMGLGKTIQAITSAYVFYNSFHILKSSTKKNSTVTRSRMNFHFLWSYRAV